MYVPSLARRDVMRCSLFVFFNRRAEFGGFFCDETNTPKAWNPSGIVVGCRILIAYYGTTYGARGARSHDRPPCHGNQAGAGAATKYCTAYGVMKTTGAALAVTR